MIKKLYFILATTIIYLIFFSTPVQAKVNKEYPTFKSDIASPDTVKTLSYMYLTEKTKGYYASVNILSYNDDGSIDYEIYFSASDIYQKNHVDSIKTLYNMTFDLMLNYEAFPTYAFKSTEIISPEDYANMKTIKERENENTENGNQGNNGDSEENNNNNGETGGTGNTGNNSDNGSSENGENDSGNQGDNGELGESGHDEEQGHIKSDDESIRLLEHIYNAIIMQNFVTSLLFGACVCGFAIKLKF